MKQNTLVFAHFSHLQPRTLRESKGYRESRAVSYQSHSIGLLEEKVHMAVPLLRGQDMTFPRLN